MSTIREALTWTNRQLFIAIECHTPDELVAQSAASIRSINGEWITKEQAEQWRAELMASHADMDETAGIAA